MQRNYPRMFLSADDQDKDGLLKPHYGQKMKEMDSAKFRQKIQILLDFSRPQL